MLISTNDEASNDLAMPNTLSLSAKSTVSFTLRDYVYAYSTNDEASNDLAMQDTLSLSAKSTVSFMLRDYVYAYFYK